MSFDLKQQAYHFCETYVCSKLEKIHREINGLKGALQSETKSTAGDKHETARAMLQLEREKLGKRLLLLEKMQQTLKRVPLRTKQGGVALGSLVRTDKATFFISISAGKLETGTEVVYCVSLAAPIGQLLMGRTKGATFYFNGEPAKIIDIT